MRDGPAVSESERAESEWGSEAASTAAASVGTPASPAVSRVSAAPTTPLGTCGPGVMLTPERRQRTEENRLEAERRKAVTSAGDFTHGG